ncbi:hypothetical protein [uncultured Treponema sp.]|uniref:hypothetical protein n=1 Tax=uncultured Treponema sp. TaxID=162155 RepID=UPI0025E93241|nr:hypothetical protein [uncultured Treponema sp.]
MKIEKRIIKNATTAILFFVTGFSVFAQQSGAFESEEANSRSSIGARTAASGLAEQEFRRGVQAYYRGAFNDSILQFEKALSYLPEEMIILDWLGKAYYRSGIEGAALEHWQYASNEGYGGLLLQNRIEIVRDRRLLAGGALDKPVRYTESGSYNGKNEEGNLVFSQPVSVLPNNDGTVWLLSYGSNELLKMDLNGLVIDRNGGYFNGFDRPMDLIRLHNGNLLVSEFAGDRISMFTSKGAFVKSFGKKGGALGGMVGPQYMAEDSDGNIYVSDFGNSRVDVFDSEGNPLFFFGKKSDDFAGLKGPTGIAVYENSVFVADCLTGAVHRFDVSGNYLGLLCKNKTFKKPEAMKRWGKYLVICDTNKVYSIDTDTGSLFENLSSGNAPSRLTSAVPDINGNILVTDFSSNEIYVMAKLSEVVGGLFVQIERVISDSFPKVTLEVKVENRSRQSIVGLKENNFFITENKSPVMDYKLEGSAYVNDYADITLLIDRSVSSSRYEESMENAVKEISAAMNNKGTLRIVSAGTVPLIEYEGAPEGGINFKLKNLKNPASSNVALDVAVRMCSNALINAAKKCAIVYIGDGKVSQLAFSKYGLSDLTAYLNNNSIGFVNLLLAQGTADSELNYLCDHTEGGEYYVYRDTGLSGMISDIIDIPAGSYILSYTSSLGTDFGQRYLPVELEAFIMNRSGRDETGYFAPLQ